MFCSYNTVRHSPIRRFWRENEVKTSTNLAPVLMSKATSRKTHFSSSLNRKWLSKCTFSSIQCESHLPGDMSVGGFLWKLWILLILSTHICTQQVGLYSFLCQSLSRIQALWISYAQKKTETHSHTQPWIYINRLFPIIWMHSMSAPCRETETVWCLVEL